jgi:hypothetical protein
MKSHALAAGRAVGSPDRRVLEREKAAVRDPEAAGSGQASWGSRAEAAAEPALRGVDLEERVARAWEFSHSQHHSG